MGDAAPPGATGVFDAYARYYDLLYYDKDYAAEARFVHDVLLGGERRVGNLLELGCGTGRHALEFARLGWRVKGYDLSAGMIARAKARAADAPADIRDRTDFGVGDVRSVRDGAVFDAVISLFHVMSYQTTNDDLMRAVTTGAAHLRAGGEFLFDFWYTPAVLTDPPTVRTKQLKDAATSVMRRARPEVDCNANVVTVHYEIRVRDIATACSSCIEESHRMRHFSIPELSLALGQGGLAIEKYGRWMDHRAPGTDSWYVWLLARKQ